MLTVCFDKACFSKTNFSKKFSTFSVNLPIHKSPVSPAEILVALHQIESASCEIKTVIYGEITIFFFIQFNYIINANELL